MRPLHGILVLLTVIALVSISFVSPSGVEEVSLPPIPSFSSSEPSLMSNITDNPAYLENFSLTAAFEAKMQFPDGGIDESEDIHYLNTDNTLEAIWIWSRYYTLTRDNRYFANISAAWNYSWANPAWLEGDSGKVYSCAWALKAELEYRRAYGRRDNIAYANRCATFILNRNGWDTLVMLKDWGKNDIRGLAAGNLYDWAIEQGNETARQGALALGNATMAAITANSSWLLEEDWALAGGVAYWGVVHSTFREYPNVTWAEQYGAILKTNVTTLGGQPGNSQCGWYAWYALGHYAAWNATGNTSHLNQSLGMIAWLLMQDGDMDGGIPTNFGEPDDTDESWVTSYRSLNLGEFLTPWLGQPPDAPILTSAGFRGPMDEDITIMMQPPIQDSAIGDVMRYDMYRGVTYDPAGAGYTRRFSFPAGMDAVHDIVPANDPTSYFYFVVAVDRDWLVSPMSNQAARLMPYPGWVNGTVLMGTSLIHESDAIFDVVGGAFTFVNYIRAYDASSPSPWSSFYIDRQYQSLHSLPIGTGFWANVSAFEGVLMGGIVPGHVEIQLKAGWNLISYCSMSNRTVADTLAGVPWLAAEVFDSSQPKYHLRRASPSDILRPGLGFWVLVDSDSTLVFTN